MYLCRSRAAREAKELTASACVWALEGVGTSVINYPRILARAVRCRDPFLRVRGNWVTRRLAPDYVHLGLAGISAYDRLRLLHAMGWETANVHLGSGPKAIERVRKDLQNREEGWLVDAAELMYDVTEEDWYDWVTAFSAGEASGDLGMGPEPLTEWMA
jgi:hypothetical protein